LFSQPSILGRKVARVLIYFFFWDDTQDNAFNVVFIAFTSRQTNSKFLPDAFYCFSSGPDGFFSVQSCKTCNLLMVKLYQSQAAPRRFRPGISQNCTNHKSQIKQFIVKKNQTLQLFVKI